MSNIQSVSASAYGAQSFQPASKASWKKDPQPVLPNIAGEKVELSNTSVIFSRLKEKIDAIPEVRIQMVEEIKQRIKNNEYPFTNNLFKALDKMMEANLVWTLYTNAPWMWPSQPRRILRYPAGFSFSCVSTGFNWFLIPRIK